MARHRARVLPVPKAHGARSVIAKVCMVWLALAVALAWVHHLVRVRGRRP